MRVENFVFLLEELSAKEMIKIILPKIIPHEVRSFLFSFEGKSDLEKNVTKKIRGWQKENTVFLVMRDQDSGDCKTVKKNLLAECKKSQKLESLYLVRIACHELESFYLGDMDAVQKAGYKVALSKRFKNGYATPDDIGCPADD